MSGTKGHSGIYKRTKRIRENISKGCKGHSGIYERTKKTREKMSEAQKGNKKALGNIPWNKDKTGIYSKETRRKMGEANKGNIPWNKNKKMTKENTRKRLRRRTPSSLEKKFQKIIDKYSLPYRFVGNGSFFIEQYNPDFINTNSEKIAIEVYARFYKQLDNRNIEKWKKERGEMFAKYGWSIIYFDETQVNEDYVLTALQK